MPRCPKHRVVHGWKEKIICTYCTILLPNYHCILLFPLLTRCIVHTDIPSKGYITVEPRYNEVLGTMKITLLYQVSHYIRVKKQRNIKSWDQQNYLVIRGFCYIWPLYNEVSLYTKQFFFLSVSLVQGTNTTLLYVCGPPNKLKRKSGPEFNKC